MKLTIGILPWLLLVITAIDSGPCNRSESLHFNGTNVNHTVECDLTSSSLAPDNNSNVILPANTSQAVDSILNKITRITQQSRYGGGYSRGDDPQPTITTSAPRTTTKEPFYKVWITTTASFSTTTEKAINKVQITTTAVPSFITKKSIRVVLSTTEPSITTEKVIREMLNPSTLAYNSTTIKPIREVLSTTAPSITTEKAIRETLNTSTLTHNSTTKNPINKVLNTTVLFYNSTTMNSINEVLNTTVLIHNSTTKNPINEGVNTPISIRNSTTKNPINKVLNTTVLIHNSTSMNPYNEVQNTTDLTHNSTTKNPINEGVNTPISIRNSTTKNSINKVLNTSTLALNSTTKKSIHEVLNTTVSIHNSTTKTPINEILNATALAHNSITKNPINEVLNTASLIHTSTTKKPIREVLNTATLPYKITTENNNLVNVTLVKMQNNTVNPVSKELETSTKQSIEKFNTNVANKQVLNATVTDQSMSGTQEYTSTPLPSDPCLTIKNDNESYEINFLSKINLYNNMTDAPINYVVMPIPSETLVETIREANESLQLYKNYLETSNSTIKVELDQEIHNSSVNPYMMMLCVDKIKYTSFQEYNAKMLLLKHLNIPTFNDDTMVLFFKLPFENIVNLQNRVQINEEDLRQFACWFRCGVNKCKNNTDLSNQINIYTDIQVGQLTSVYFQFKNETRQCYNPPVCKNNPRETEYMILFTMFESVLHQSIRVAAIGNLTYFLDIPYTNQKVQLMETMSEKVINWRVAIVLFILIVVLGSMYAACVQVQAHEKHKRQMKRDNETREEARRKEEEDKRKNRNRNPNRNQLEGVDNQVVTIEDEMHVGSNWIPLQQRSSSSPPADQDQTWSK